MGRTLHDLTGQRFSRLLVLNYLGREHHSSAWLCRCDCGAEIKALSAALKAGQRKSCGCYRRDRMSTMTLKHGERGGALRPFQTYEYRTWNRMVERCHDPKHMNFKDYGGRGIVVCERWRADFGAFLADMGRKASKRHSIDRIDVNGHYEPGNCRWASPLEQARNRSNNRAVTFCGQHFSTLSAAAESVGLPYKTVKARVGKGWSVDDALARPVDEAKRDAQPSRLAA
jgi:hypothetical protein